MKLQKFSLGIGDRFAHQGRAQLQAIMDAQALGVDITPIWNKSYREHQIIGSTPEQTRQAADAAVKSLNWRADYFVDADHIGLKNVDFFLTACDFFTIDVADQIGKAADARKTELFIKQQDQFLGQLFIPSIETPFTITRATLADIAQRYLLAIEEAGKIYAYLVARKGSAPFLVEVSMDETQVPQSPIEIFFILAGLAQKEMPLATIAPKFSGRFNKGIDYVGQLDEFVVEFRQDLAAVQFAQSQFPILQGVKLSVHSGSDKFSLYRPMQQILKEMDAGVHLKTAGTTWLEELIGLAEAGGDGLALAKDIYRQAYARFQELVSPYATVISVAVAQLPAPEVVGRWDEATFTAALRHQPENPSFNKHFRQLLHVAYKIAAEMGPRYLNLLAKYETTISRNVRENLFERHIKPLFLSPATMR